MPSRRASRNPFPLRTPAEQKFLEDEALKRAQKFCDISRKKNEEALKHYNEVMKKFEEEDKERAIQAKKNEELIRSNPLLKGILW